MNFNVIPHQPPNLTNRCIGVKNLNLNTGLLKVNWCGEASLIPILTSNSIIWTHTLKITFTSNKGSLRYI